MSILIAILTELDFLVRFLKTLMPRKPLAEPYTAIGYHKHGKTEFYRDFLRHLQAPEDQFEKAEGAPGMVMVDHHGDLFQAAAWRRVQTALRAGNIPDIFPYDADKRLLPEVSL